MGKLRFIYAKTGVAKYISHLDLMTVLRRSFARADIALTHSEGFNPHPYLSVALPLPVGVESQCEILDVKLEQTPDVAILSTLNNALPPGLIMLGFTEEIKPVKDIALTRYSYTTNPLSPNTYNLHSFLKTDPVIVDRKTKSGIKPIDLVPYVRSDHWHITEEAVTFTADLSANDPQLNPLLLKTALCQAFPSMDWQNTAIRRLMVLDKNGQDFIGIMRNQL